MAEELQVADLRPAEPALGGQAERTTTLSVVVCAYTTRRWTDICRAAESVLSQQWPVTELILVIDHCDELYDRACDRFGGDERVLIRRNVEAPGLSGARNTGVAAAHGDVIAFLDDDASAETLRNRGLERTPAKRKLLARIEARAKAAGRKPVPSNY